MLRHPPNLEKDKNYKHRTKSTSPVQNKEQKAAALCSVYLEAIGDFQFRTALKPQLDFVKVKKSDTIELQECTIRQLATGPRACGSFWRRLARPDAGVRLGELEHPSLKKNAKQLHREGPYLCSPLSF